MPEPRLHQHLPRTFVAVVLGAILWLLLSIGGAAAAAPTIVGGLTDEVGALDACRQKVLSAQQQLFDQTGTNLFLVYVASTDGVDMSDYIDQLIDGSNGQVTEKDALLAIATQDRDYQLYTGSQLNESVGVTELDSVTTTYVLPALRTSDWCAAAAGAAVGLQTAIGGDVTPDKPPVSGSGGGGLPGWLIVLVVLAVIGGVAFWFLRGRANRALFKERSAQEDLGKQASSLLIATDDALRAADQELGFAQAQFGDAQAVPLGKALDEAKAELRQSFLLSQQLDDETPETPEQRHTMLQEIIDRCTRAQGMVTEQMARIAKLRDLAKNVDQVLPQTVSAVETQGARVAPARAVLTALGARFAAENIAAVAGNPDAADTRLASARTALDAAAASLTAGERDAAVTKVQEAETAIAEAAAQLDAVDQSQTALAQGETQLGASIAAVQLDITNARAALAAGKGTDRAAEVDKAAALLTTAQAMAGATPLDVVGATRAATEANSIIDGVLAGIQAGDAAVARNAAAAQAAFANATASVTQANALIGANAASTAGRRARTRVAEAQQYLARAQSLMATDPATAAQASQTADALADEAIAEMQAFSGSSGVSGNTRGGSPTRYGSGSGGYTQPSGGGGLESFLGGLLGGMLSGGGGTSGRRNSGWSGGSGGFGGFGSGGFGGSSGGSSGGGRSSGGSGGGHSGRRSGGGF